jgi:hypothetical protein
MLKKLLGSVLEKASGKKKNIESSFSQGIRSLNEERKAREELLLLGQRRKSKILSDKRDNIDFVNSEARRRVKRVIDPHVAAETRIKSAEEILDRTKRTLKKIGIR